VFERILGKEHPDSLATRASLAHWIKEAASVPSPGAGPYPLRWTPGFSCPIRRESEKWVRHAARIRRSTRRSR
jgi:hypothetical protein